MSDVTGQSLEVWFQVLTFDVVQSANLQSARNSVHDLVLHHTGSSRHARYIYPPAQTASLACKQR